MIYDNPLPPVRNLLKLAKEVEFPATRKEITHVAYEWGFSDTMLDFLGLYPADEVFQSKVDFMTRCEELELLIYQKNESPVEYTRSPQD